MRKIFYQGEPGCFSEIAIKKVFGDKVERIGLRYFDEVMKKVTKYKESIGILPIENTLIGKISYNYDLMLENPVQIIGEVKLSVHFSLIVHPQANPENIKEVWSHPAALGQCKSFLSENKYKPVSIYDTAGGAKYIIDKNRKDIGILADRNVAKRYGLKIIAEKVEDNENNFTRFVFISQKKKKVPIKGKTKTSIVFGVKNAPGVLFKCLSVFALSNINLCSIESRPIKGKPWEYLFFVDFEGDMNDGNAAKSVEDLREIVDYLKIFGSYNSVEVR